MKMFIKGAVVALATTGMVLGASNSALAVVQAPTETVVSEEKKVAVLFPENPLPELYKEEDVVETTVNIIKEDPIAKRLTTLECRFGERKKQEQIEKERLRKKRLAIRRARLEKKRRQEIKACCGVAAGSNDQKILERIVEAEAGGESFKGKVLVANVILNRVKSKKFPNSIEGVVFAHSGNRYQFSPISDGRYYTVNVSNDTKKAVEAALNGKDPSKGALYFMERSAASAGNVSWFDRALTRLFRCGCHEFFK